MKGGDDVLYLITLSLIDSPVALAQSTPDPRVAGSIPSLDRAICIPPAQCFVWYLEIFHTQHNGGFISIIFLLNFAKNELLVKTVDPRKDVCLNCRSL